MFPWIIFAAVAFATLLTAKSKKHVSINPGQRVVVTFSLRPKSTFDSKKAYDAIAAQLRAALSNIATVNSITTATDGSGMVVADLTYLKPGTVDTSGMTVPFTIPGYPPGTASVFSYSIHSDGKAAA